MTSQANDRILAATLALITERGIAGTTMSAIATNAGVARQTLYNHYRDVESVVYAATVAHQQQSFEQLTAVLNTIETPAGRLEHLVRHVAALATHGHPSVRGGFSAEIAELMASHDMAMHGLVAAALDDGQARGVFRDNLEPGRDATLVLRMIEAVGELVAADPEDIGAIVATTVRSVLAAVGTRPEQ